MSVDLMRIPPHIADDPEKREVFEYTRHLIEEAGCLSIMTLPFLDTYTEQMVRARRITRQAEMLEAEGGALEKGYATLLFRSHQCFVHAGQIWKQMMAYKVSSTQHLPYRTTQTVDPGLIDGSGMTNVISLKNNRQL